MHLILKVLDPVDRFTTGGLKRWLLNANQGFGKGVTVSPHTLDVPPDKVRAALEKFAPKG